MKTYSTHIPKHFNDKLAVYSNKTSKPTESYAHTAALFNSSPKIQKKKPIAYQAKKRSSSHFSTSILTVPDASVQKAQKIPVQEEKRPVRPVVHSQSKPNSGRSVSNTTYPIHHNTKVIDQQEALQKARSYFEKAKFQKALKILNQSIDSPSINRLKSEVEKAESTVNEVKRLRKHSKCPSILSLVKGLSAPVSNYSIIKNTHKECKRKVPSRKME